jgi:dihydrofolate synthase/folylpolyglutamate synthase
MKPDSPGRTLLKRWLRELESRHHKTIDLDLSRCGAVYQRLGKPRPARRVITVAGTNGKGSTVAWASAALRLLSQSHGTYTSPHLMRFNERLRLNGKVVNDKKLVGAFEEVEAARESVSLTFFEFTTLACLLIMSRERLDTAVLEVGLGGRLDTVNLIDTDLAVITPIGLDHQAYLGDDRQTIGREKAGILRSGKPVVAGEQRPPLSVLERADELGCPVLLPGRDFGLEDRDDGRLSFHLEGRRFEFRAPEFAGLHQRDNLAVGLAAALAIHPELGSDTLQEALGEGLASVTLPGRLQPVGYPPGYLVDVGHNPMAAAVIQKALEARDERCICVLGMLADKDAESVARLLAPSVSLFLCAGLEDGWRAQSGHALATRVRSAVDGASVEAFPTVRSAMKAARRRAQGVQRVLVFGSFHTAAQALRWLDEKGIGKSAGETHDPIRC